MIQPFGSCSYCGCKVGLGEGENPFVFVPEPPDDPSGNWSLQIVCLMNWDFMGEPCMDTYKKDLRNCRNWHQEQLARLDREQPA